MKLLVNYDFFDAVRNVNEPLNPMKIIRNEKKKYGILFPLYLSIILAAKEYGDIDTSNLIDARYIMLYMMRSCGFCMSLDFAVEAIIKKLSNSKTDTYARKAIARLQTLALMLDDINVHTTYDMLLASELYHKKVYLDSSESKRPILVSQKYIYVPSYGFDGEEKTTSILQEHVIGTKEYILSQDEPDRQYKRVLAKSHI